MKKRQIVNFVNFIRGCEPRCEMDLITPVKEQINLLKKYDFKGTFLLQYDALINPEFTDMLLALSKDQFEIGVWFETVQQLVEKAGIKWRGRYTWDWHADCGFSVGYTKTQRKAMIDVLFEDFKNIFGFYPKSFGSWAFDVVTLGYAQEKYGLDAACNCKDQWGTDGYTLWGGYYGQAYYPSKINAYTPAQNAENQINVPVFRMLGSDQVLQYDFGYDINGSIAGIGHQGVITLEPVYNNQYGGGGVKKWVDWYLKENFSGKCLSFGYAQAGQENSFGWDAMKDGLTYQCEKIHEMVSKNLLEVETMGETGRWYKSQFKETPASVIAADNDWKDEGKKSLWYSCKNYRINFYAEKNKFWIRDLYLFDENYSERYMEKVCTSNKLEYDNLPVIDGIRFCGDGKRSGLYIRKNSENKDEGLAFSDVDYEDSNGAICLTFKGTELGTVTVRADENGVEIQAADRDFYIIPVYAGFTKEIMSCKKACDERADFCFNDFNYSVELEKGKLEESLFVSSCEKTVKVKL